MFKKAAIVSLFGLWCCSIGLAADSGRQYVPAPTLPGNAPALPFSQGVMVAGTFYVAGHIGMDPATQKLDDHFSVKEKRKGGKKLKKVFMKIALDIEESRT